MENEIKTGLWNKTSQNGNTYASGKVSINGKDFKITMFVNNKTKDTQPDYRLLFNEIEGSYQKAVESIKADEIVIDDSDLPF